MLDLSNKYFSAVDDRSKMQIASAGEAMLISGPGGLLTLAWLILFSAKLFKMGR